MPLQFYITPNHTTMYPFSVFLKNFGPKYPHLQPSTPSSFLPLPLSRPPPILQPDPALPPLALLLPLAAILLVNHAGPLVNRAPARELIARSGVASGARQRSGEGGRAGSGQGESVGGEEPALGSSSGGERPEVELGVEELGGGHGGRRNSSGASRGGGRRGGRRCSQGGAGAHGRTAQGTHACGPQ